MYTKTSVFYLSKIHPIRSSKHNHSPKRWYLAGEMPWQHGGFIVLKPLQYLEPSRTNYFFMILKAGSGRHCGNQTDDAEHTIVWCIKFDKERHTEITFRKSINIRNLMRILMESKENWNMVDGFVLKILDFKGREIKVKIPSGHEVVLKGDPMVKKTRKTKIEFFWVIHQEERAKPKQHQSGKPLIL